MTILDRHFTYRFVATFAKTVFALVVLFCIIDLLAERRNDIIEHDIPPSVIFAYYVARVPALMYQIAPLAVLISGLLVFGEASQHREVTASLAGGVSLRRLVRGPVLAAMVIAVGVFALDQNVGAVSIERAETIEKDYFMQGADDQRAGVSWPALPGNWTCHILKFNRLAKSGETVHMYALREDANEHIVARRIYWHPERQAWLIEDGWWFVNSPDWRNERSRTRITRAEAPIAEPPETLFALEQSAETKTAAELLRDIRRAEARGQSAASQWVDYHAKYSYPAICFIMIFLAIPFALRLRRGGLAISAGASVAIAITFMVAFGFFHKLGQIGALPPALGAWFANLVFFAAGLILFARTPT